MLPSKKCNYHFYACREINKIAIELLLFSTSPHRSSNLALQQWAVASWPLDIMLTIQEQEIHVRYPHIWSGAVQVSVPAGLLNKPRPK
jgi:hypothetical protein